MRILPLFPNRLRPVGFALLIPGAIFAYLYFYGGKPDFFVSRIFAIVTSYAETRYWVNAQTNLLDELAALFIIGGLSFLVFSKEKSENETTYLIRLKTLIYASYVTIIVWLISFFLFYGWAIFIFSSFMFLVFLLSNLIIFRIMILRTKRLKQSFKNKSNEKKVHYSR